MPGSIVIRKSLGRRLKALRLAAGKTFRDVNAAGVASKAKLARIEAGLGNFRMADVRTLCWLYGADETTTELLADMALSAAGDGWWESYTDVMPQWFGMYVELEAAATSVRVFDPAAVYGVLQTPDYRAAVTATEIGITDEEVKSRLRLHEERQRAALECDPPLRITAVLEEGVLHRVVGGKEVMAQQVSALQDWAREPHIEILVLPWAAGAHIGTKGPMAILGYEHDEGVPDVVYLETYTGARYVERNTVVQECQDMFASMRVKSVPIEEYLR